MEKIYGKHPVIDAIKSGASVDKVVLQQGLRGDLEKEMRQLSKQHGIPVQFVPKERMNKMVRGNHQGIIAWIAPIQLHKIETILPALFEQEETPLLLILDGVTDVRNMGAIARTAECFGVHALILPQKGSARINEEAMKASAGALSKIPICRESSMMNTLAFLGRSGVQVLASSLQAEQSIEEMDFKEPTAIVVGAEGPGISKAIAMAADALFLIPQKGTTDSLNVSVATGVILYEVNRQRG